MEKTTVIIPNYNGKHFLEDCMKALTRQTSGDFAVCVVDNGSEDGSVEFLRSEYPRVKLICFEKNTGFCHAVNAGVKAADTEYVLLLNNDTVPEKDFVAELEKGLDRHPDVFSCASCMLTLQDETILDGAGDLYSALGWAFARGHDEKASIYNRPAYVFSACAGAAIYRREEFIRLGMLDEKHFAYLEDMDIGWKARLAGWKNLYVPAARVVHAGSGTTGSRHNEFKVRMSARNNIYIIRKNMTGWQKVINAPLILLGTAVKYLYFKKKGLGSAYLKGFKQGRALPASSPQGTAFPVQLKIQLELWANVTKRRK